MIREKTIKKKEKKNISYARVYIQASFNNTIISVTDVNGNVISWSSAGSKGFKGARKSTPYAAKIVGEDIIDKVQNVGIQTIEINVQGAGSGRESAIRSIVGGGFKVEVIRDTTAIPHNGCRPPKKRRI